AAKPIHVTLTRRRRLHQPTTITRPRGGLDWKNSARRSAPGTSGGGLREFLPGVILGLVLVPEELRMQRRAWLGQTGTHGAARRAPTCCGVLALAALGCSAPHTDLYDGSEPTGATSATSASSGSAATSGGVSSGAAGSGATGNVDASGSASQQ